MVATRKYHCEKCNYSSNKCDFEKHKLSKKHNSEGNVKPKIYVCKFCQKTFTSQSGLRKHNIQCIKNDDIIVPSNEESVSVQGENQELMEEIKKMNTKIDELNAKNNQTGIIMTEFIKNQQTQIIPTELKIMMQEILKNQKQPTTILNTNTINNNFNINVFLKEVCNEALNMDTFTKNIMYEFGNVQDMLTDYVKGSISILRKNWEQIPLNKRPIFRRRRSASTDISYSS
jgi:hypothetical protein